MASAEEYAGWIVKNQDKKGTPEFEIVAQAYKVAKGGIDESKPVTMQKLPTMRESISETLAADAFPTGAKFVGGVGTFMDDAAYRLKQLVGGKLDPQETARVLANRDFLTAGGAPAMAGNITGALMATGTPATGLFKGAANLAGKVLPASVAPTVAGAAVGATQAALTQPVLDGESTGMNMAMGATGGALGDVAARGLARVAQPVMQSEPVKRLLKKGVVPTPGQAAGGMLNRAEEAFGSQPIVGDVVRNARERATKEFNRAALNTAMPQGKVTQSGDAGFSEVKAALSNAYDEVFQGKSVRPDNQMVQGLLSAKTTPVTPLNRDGERAFNNTLKRIVFERLPQNGQLTASQVKTDFIGDLGKEARDYLKSPLKSERAVGEALMAARDSLNNWLVGKVAATNPQAAAQIAKIDPAYANRMLLQKAVERGKGAGGQFTPFQLQSSTPTGTPLRALANDAQSILANRLPNSGSADRLLYASLLGVGLGGANEISGGPGYLTAIALSPLAFSRTGARYMLGDLPLQSAASGMLRSAAPAAVNAGALSALLNQRQ